MLSLRSIRLRVSGVGFLAGMLPFCSSNLAMLLFAQTRFRNIRSIS